jgi:ATP-binding cassette, subfamily A (ABC1), member 3
MKAAQEGRKLETNFETKYIKEENFEPPDISLQQTEKKRNYLRVQDLRKVFSNGFRAVDGVNVRMYEGQIFALLGHNGAGKTTMISMLTGMLKATEGYA